MKKINTIYFLFGLTLLFNNATAQSLKLWYTKPAQKWTEALPVGNGRLGAMIFGGVQQERIQFNEETLWNGSPRDYNRKGAYHYLDSIRHLLFNGKQKEAEALAEKEFMGLKSPAGDRNAWVKKMLAMKGMNGNPTLSSYNDAGWKQMTVPSYDGWEAVGFENLDGAVWFRTSFDLPDHFKGKDLVLDLNRIRDQDFTYVNGNLVGSMNNTEPRKYKVSKNLLHAGRNTIAVLVLNYSDKGGIQGYKDTTRHIGLYPAGEERNLLSLNGKWKYKIQDQAPPAIEHYEADYQPFGDLWIRFPVTDSLDYTRQLDLATAQATTTFTSNGVHYTRTVFASQPSQAIVIRFTADQKSSISFDASLTTPHPQHQVNRIDANTISMTLAVTNGALKGACFLRAKTVNGSISVADNKIQVKNADEVILYLTAATNYRNYKDVSLDPVNSCRTVLKNISTKNFSTLHAEHIKEYQKYFNTFSIDLGKTSNEILPTNERIEKFSSSSDPSLAALYVQYGRYLLISASRPGTRPANLQGIWNDNLAPPWGSKYTTNINLEMNYWPAELLNLSPLHQSLFVMMKELSVTGNETAREYYNAPGWVLHHNTDLWRATVPINASNHGIWVPGAAWLCHHLWEHYLFTQDLKFLKDTAYPLMKGAAAFFDSFLVKDPATGYLISAPSNSPENGGLVAGPTMDHEIIKDLFRNTIEAAALLHVDAAFSKELNAKLQRIAPYQVGMYGQLQEWMQDIDDTSNKHRHVSHLWAVYPGSELNWDATPDLMKAARQSLLYRGDAATGWSLAWKINYWARFKDGDHAYKLLQMLLSPAGSNAGSYPNLFDAHPPFQIDGNFGGAAGVGEMILQSHTTYIDLLPALPSAFPDGKVNGICARGGFILNISWKNGQLQQVALSSLAGKEARLRYGNKVAELHTQKGKQYILNSDLKVVVTN